MSKECTEEDIKYMIRYGYLKGSLRLIQKRCIEGIPVNLRPLHCVDASRKKLLIKKKHIWETDANHEKLLSPVEEIAKMITDKLMETDTDVTKLLTDHTNFLKKKDYIFNAVINDLIDNSLILLDDSNGEKVEYEVELLDDDEILSEGDDNYIDVV